MEFHCSYTVLRDPWFFQKGSFRFIFLRIVDTWHTPVFVCVSELSVPRRTLPLIYTWFWPVTTSRSFPTCPFVFVTWYLFLKVGLFGWCCSTLRIYVGLCNTSALGRLLSPDENLKIPYNSSSCTLFSFFLPHSRSVTKTEFFFWDFPYNIFRPCWKDNQSFFISFLVDWIVLLWTLSSFPVGGGNRHIETYVYVRGLFYLRSDDLKSLRRILGYDETLVTVVVNRVTICLFTLS